MSRSNQSSKPPSPASSCPPGQVHDGCLGRGRTISIAKDEALQKRFRRLQQSSSGRQELRERVSVERALAHIAARKGDHARYLGARKNLFDLRRASVIQNLDAAQRIENLEAAQRVACAA